MNKRKGSGFEKRPAPTPSEKKGYRPTDTGRKPPKPQTSKKGKQMGDDKGSDKKPPKKTPKTPIEKLERVTEGYRPPDKKPKPNKPDKK